MTADGKERLGALATADKLLSLFNQGRRKRWHNDTAKTCGQHVCLTKLYNAVQQRGGYKQVRSCVGECNIFQFMLHSVLLSFN